MKEKSKKILKGFGVGALACLGMFGLTGCANVDISQKKVDSLIERFEEFSEKTTREEIVNLCKTAYYNGMFRTNGYENVVMTINYGGTEGEIHVYASSDMIMSASISGSFMSLEYFDMSTGKVVDTNITLTRHGYVCTYKDVSDELDVSKFDVYNPAGIGEAVSFDNLVSYKLLDNGNYTLLFIDEQNDTYYSEEKEEELGEYTITNYYKIEITKDAKIISLKQKSDVDVDFACDEQDWEEIKSYLVDAEGTYSYGNVDVELLQELYEIAQAAPETPDEGE